METTYSEPGTVTDWYIHDYPRVSQFFSFSPHQADSFQERANFLDKTFTQDRTRLAEQLVQYNSEIGAGERALQNAASLRLPETLAVVTGQQAGVLTGPVFTVYKAMSAVYLAKKLSQQLARPVVPIFWVASEDHDYREINHLFIINRDAQLEKISFSPVPDGRRSVGTLPVRPWGQGLLAQLREIAPQGPYKEKIIEDLQQLTDEAPDIAHWFASIMAMLFREYGLVMLDPMLPLLRSLGREAMVTAVKENTHLNRSLTEQSEMLIRMGIRPAIQKDFAHSHLFVYHQGNRLPMYRKENGFCAGKVYLSQAEVLERIRLAPQTFSPDVVLRPVMQDFILPTLAYVAGPGEIEYLAQLKGVFRVFGMELPVIIPRLSMTIFGPEQVDLVERYRGSVPQVLEDVDGWLEKVLRDKDELQLRSLFAQTRQAITETYGQLWQTLEILDKNMKKLWNENLGRIMFQVDYLQKKAWQRHCQKHKLLIREFEQFRTYVRPLGRRQEMVYNVFPFLFTRGYGFINLLLNSAPLMENFTHKIVWFS